jgi:hypothetical protein
MMNYNIDPAVTILLKSTQRERVAMIMTPLSEKMSQLTNIFTLIEKGEVYDEKIRTTMIEAWDKFDLVMSEMMFESIKGHLGANHPMVETIRDINSKKKAALQEKNYVS